MLNFNSVMISSEDPKALAEFYKSVFQKAVDWSGGDFVGFQVGDGNLVIGPHDKVHGKCSSPERIILNFETSDVAGEAERIKGLGAKVIAEPYQPDEAETMWIATFADPDENYFQLVSPMEGK